MQSVLYASPNRSQEEAFPHLISMFISFHVLLPQIKRQGKVDETKTEGLLCFAIHCLAGRDMQMVGSFFSPSHSILFSHSAIQPLLDASWMHWIILDTTKDPTFEEWSHHSMRACNIYGGLKGVMLSQTGG